MEVEIVRVVVASNITNAVLVDHILPEWIYLREVKGIGHLFRTLLTVAKEFDDGFINYIAFQPPTQSYGSPSRRHIPEDTMDLNLCLTLTNDVVVGIFYQVPGEEGVTENINDYIRSIAERVSAAFELDHGHYYTSIRGYLEEAFQHNEELAPDIVDRFAIFGTKIPLLIAPDSS
jgi:hypothetical protein